MPKDVCWGIFENRSLLSTVTLHLFDIPILGAYDNPDQPDYGTEVMHQFLGELTMLVMRNQVIILVFATIVMLMFYHYHL
jgi:hypothetical protein